MSHNLDLTTHAIEQHGRLVFGVIWRLLPDRDEAMDLYQETFLRYHTVVQRGKTIEYPKAWLCRVATNEAFKRLRQRGRQTSLTDGSGHDQPARSNPEEEIEQSLLVQRVRILVADLPARQRDVFVLRNYEGLPFAEIADRLGCSETSARASEYKALKKIRARMHRPGGDSEAHEP